MSEDSFNIGEAILRSLQENDWETAIPYSLYDTSEYIKKCYPIRESFNRYVRKVKMRKTANPSFVPTVDNGQKVPITGKATFTEGSGEAVAESTSTRIKTLEALLEACKVDLDTWYVSSHTCNTWEQNSAENGITTLYQIKASLARVKPRIPVLQPIILPHVTRRLPPSLVKTNRSLVIGDAQIGFNRLKNGTWETFHDRKAMDVILRILEDHSFDNIVILGDMIDATEASRYTQKPEFAGTLQPSINELGIYLEHIRRLAPTSRIVLMNGNHECFSSDTEILTSEGFKKYTEVGEDTLIGTFNTLTDRVEYQKYIARQEFDHEGEMFTAKNSHNDIMVTGSHRLLFKKQNYRNDWVKQDMASIHNSGSRLVMAGATESNRTDSTNVSDAQLAILGWMLTDASINRGRIIFYQGKKKVHLIKNILNELGLLYKENTRERFIESICGKELKEDSKNSVNVELALGVEDSKKLLEISPSLDKLPDWVYDKISDRQFSVLLNSLIDGDGSRHKSSPNTSLMFYGKKELVYNLQRACFLHGYRTSIYEYFNKKGTNSDMPQYRLNITKNIQSTFSGFKNHVKKENYVGKVWDFTVPNDTLIVRRNGKISITGNCRLNNSMVDNLKYAYGLTAFKQDTPLFSFKNLLALDSMDIEFIEAYPSGKFWINDNVKVIHGEFVSLTKELSTSDTHTLMGHLHKSEMVSRSIHGKDNIRHISAHTIGCLCKIDNTVPGMTSRPNWNQGFAVVDHIGDFVGINHGFIHESVCLYQGKKYIGVDERPGGVY